MNLSRLMALVVAGCALALCPLRADDASDSPLSQFKQYSGTMVMSMANGMSMTQKMYMDNGKIRVEMTTAGMNVGGTSIPGMKMVTIARPDQGKMYTVMEAQKMVMVMPYEADKMKSMALAMAGDAKQQLVGPDTVDGVAATKYKVTVRGKTLDYWINASSKIPIKMVAEDGSMAMEWKDFQPGPQDPALFEPPTGYKVMNMPAMPLLNSSPTANVSDGAAAPPPAPTTPAPAPAPSNGQ